MNEREADIRAAFAHLRNLCDARGHDLLRVLEDEILADERAISGITSAWGAVRDLVPVFACDVDESGGHAPEDPKSNGWHSRHADLWDLREGK